MSILVIGKFKGDVATFNRALADRADEFKKFGEAAAADGLIHHRFGVGDGFIVVQDEWESAEQFQKFFSDPALQAFIGSSGADPSAPPEIIVCEAIASPDQR